MLREIARFYDNESTNTLAVLVEDETTLVLNLDTLKITTYADWEESPVTELLEKCEPTYLDLKYIDDDFIEATADSEKALETYRNYKSIVGC